MGLGGLYGHAESVNPTEQAKLNYQSPASDMDVEKEDPEKPTKKRVTLGERMTNWKQQKKRPRLKLWIKQLAEAAHGAWRITKWIVPAGV